MGLKLTARSRLSIWANVSRIQSDEETYGLHIGDMGGSIGDSGDSAGSGRPMATGWASEQRGGVEMTKPIDPQSAVEQMWKTAPRLAKAKGELVYLEEYRKSLKAILMKASKEKTSAAQETEAYAHPDYIKHLAGLQAATEAYEALRWQMVALEAAVEVWRTQSANDRRIDRAAQ